MILGYRIISFQLTLGLFYYRRGIFLHPYTSSLWRRLEALYDIILQFLTFDLFILFLLSTPSSFFSFRFSFLLKSFSLFHYFSFSIVFLQNHYLSVYTSFPAPRMPSLALSFLLLYICSFFHAFFILNSVTISSLFPSLCCSVSFLSSPLSFFLFPHCSTSLIFSSLVGL